MTTTTKRMTFVRKGRTIIKRRWDGAGDLIEETIRTADRLTGGLIDKASGGKVRGPCKGCDETKADLNERLPF
jgi:hypothetical protein